MKFDTLAILLTCHSLEDFPVHHDGEDADSLLANWTVLWHPKLISDAGKIPTWIRTYEVPENCENHLFVCPTTSDSELQTGFAKRVKEENGQLIRRKTSRDEILEAIFADQSPAEIDEETVRDFFALGYCFLQIQLLTRQLRYSSNLDEVYFANLVVDAANSAIEKNQEVTQQKLQAAFDLLMEERDNYYPVNALLLDLTLVADSTLGTALMNQLTQSQIHNNYLLSGDLARKIAQNQELQSAFSEALESGRASIVGGCHSESRLPLLSVESVIQEFASGSNDYRESLDAQVDFFGRRRYGLAPSLPQVLEHFGFKGAFHFTLDDGRFPEGMQIKSFWEGDGEARIEVFGKIPLDANASGNFLNLGVKIGESFDMDHAAAICFVHWPGQNSVWFDDLKRICRFGSVLGKFVSTTEFLEEMEEPYQHDRFTPDQYQSPYLKQAVIRNQTDPISRSIRYWRTSQLLDSVKTLDFLNAIFSKSSSTIEESIDPIDLIKAFDGNEESSNELENQLIEAEKESAAKLVEALGDDGDGSAIEVVLNMSSLVQRSSVQVDAAITPSTEKPIYATSSIPSDNKQHVVVDVPSMGYATIRTGNAETPKRKQQLLVDDLVLHNDFLEVMIDSTTGGIRAVHDYKSRGNRMSQILAYRCKSGSDSDRFVYSKMKLDSIETLVNTTTLGKVQTKGQLVFEDKKVADFTQTFTLAKGSRVVLVDAQWDNLEAPQSDPWNWYFGARFAFGDESSLISTTLNQSRQPVSGNRIEAPHYIDLENLKSRTSILTGGAPFHVRRGDRYIDSIHIVKGESERQFRFGIGVDLPNPLYHANSIHSSPLTVTSTKKPSTDFSWLFHLDSRNVLATAWQAVWEGDKVVGFRVRLLETMGRASKCKLSAFKPVQSCNRIRFDGEVVSEMSVADGKVEISLSPNQLFEIEARW